MTMKHQVGWQRKARQLLMSEAGRAALQQFGIDVELVSKEKAEEEKAKPIIAVLCPTYRAPEPQMRDALTAMVKYTHEKNLATVYSGPPLQTSVVHWSRNGLISEQLKSGKPWTHALFIDDDIVVAPDDLEKLLSHKADIVAGLCTRRNDPPIPNIRMLDPETGALSSQIWEWEEGRCIEVDGVGTGLMLISRHALEQVAQAYFDCLWEVDHFGLCGELLEAWKKARLAAFDANKICYWFRFLPTRVTSIEMGEDMSFCYVAKKYCGIPIKVDTSVKPGHIGNYAYSIRDFAPYREQMILEAKVAGSYPMEVPEMKISILCPTRGRPENVIRLITSLETTSTLMPEMLFYVDEDDKSFPGTFRLPGIKVVAGSRILLSKAFNRLSEVATGEILMLAGDDIVFKTKGWDDRVRRAFAAFPDRLVFVHGDDGVYGPKFGTHGFVHRAWIDTVSYFVPPYFSSDYNDTWINEVFNAVARRIPLNFVTEHMHPLAGKAEWDKTHEERLARHKADKMDDLYAKLAPERLRDIQKLQARLGKPWKANGESLLDR